MTIVSGSYSYSQLKKLVYGPNGIAQLPQLVDLLGGKRSMIICGKSINNTNTPRKVKELLGDNVIEHFSSIREHSPIDDVNKALSIVEDKNIDTLIAIGGGSSIDAAKTIVHFYKSTRNDESGLETIAIPTTLSAAEFTMYAGYTSKEDMKVGVASEYMTPKGVILDAELTLDTPQRLWLSSGIRALDHAVETLYRPNASYHLRKMALLALKDLFDLLPITKAHPEDVNTRQKLQLASFMSLFPDSMSVQDLRPFGPSHTIGRKVGSSYGIPHGITSCITLSLIVRLYQEHNKDEEIKNRLQEATEITKREGDLSSQIDQLIRELELSSTLTNYKVPFDHASQIAENSLKGLGDVGFTEVDVCKTIENMY
ncbi:Dehydroquinate synthase-like protein [Wallemia mellicola]|uniref:Dehydroquinate synthase-like protein n=2 Tax=Wallemia mellicola TaxID=1708541 RepID=A0A4T0QF33_9BASI|nr:Dehydroquinate synthase-like protein [Wallemia mellicola CBS 633.66]TIB67244.1 hypothetical protein E3Q24_04225 [Wallemia mellicola]EIM21949.1 Dehydroquinate synthase-like protein [Wallemia mellicola CBS 633.66]TIB69765.1 hypothetical protein E3Q23_04250 [Wallemia mellicola]TIB74122.1 Dehydroquinate synthase-like protein [Wallemia mellicola]TIB85505.1 Dehydroquinate synthase-like protein [Wallemia mellicola]|eukprot:XP_006957761.1 Dehydroquinate synthase-like protein [Wallemia mellicola CBS 633.66]